MSRKRLQKLKYLTQRKPSQDTIMSHIMQMFPTHGMRTEHKAASLKAFYTKRGG